MGLSYGAARAVPEARALAHTRAPARSDEHRPRWPPPRPPQRVRPVDGCSRPRRWPIPGAYLREVERGERRPSPGTLRAVVAALGGSRELLEELLALGRATAQLADERPERRSRRRSQIARDDATRTRAIARGDWATAHAATDRTLAKLGIDSAAETLDELSDPARQAELLAMLDELANPEATPHHENE